MSDERAYRESRLGGDFTLAGAGYQRLGLPFNEALYRQRAAVLRRVLQRHGIRPLGARVLELGPGTGFYVERWRRAGVAELVGLDITAVAVERLAACYAGYRFAVADVGEGLPAELAPPGSFDLVTAFDVLFHIREDAAFARALAGAAEALRPGGHLLISDLFLHDAPLEGERQKSRTLAEYEAGLAAAGLRVLGRHPVFVLMHPAVDLPPGRRRDLALRWWRWLSRTLAHHPGRGRWLGRALGAADRALTRVVREGPTVELLVAERPV